MTRTNDILEWAPSVHYVGIWRTRRVWRMYRGTKRPLNPRIDLIQYSSHGLSWGSTGPGARQLAVALIADAVDDETALEAHQAVAWHLVSGLGDQWSLTEENVREAVEKAQTLPIITPPTRRTT